MKCIFGQGFVDLNETVREAELITGSLSFKVVCIVADSIYVPGTHNPDGSIVCVAPPADNNTNTFVGLVSDIGRSTIINSFS